MDSAGPEAGAGHGLGGLERNCSRYPQNLVNLQKTMENHHMLFFLGVNERTKWAIETIAM